MTLLTTLPRKLPDWEARLHAFLDTRKATPFAWGVNDCCLFAADAVQAQTGVDIADKFRGKYNSEASCMALLAQMGYDSVETMVRKELNAWQFPPVQPAFAHRGDLVLTTPAFGLGGAPALCVVALDGKTALGVGERGLMKVRTYHDTVQAWRIRYAEGAR